MTAIYFAFKEFIEILTFLGHLLISILGGFEASKKLSISNSKIQLRRVTIARDQIIQDNNPAGRCSAFKIFAGLDEDN